MILTIPYNGTAKITRFNNPNHETLIEGPLKTDGNGSYEIEREEGDVCSTSALIEMYHDVVLGENASAEVRVKYPEDSPTAERLCGGIERIEGSYTRIEVKPLTKRCAPPQGYGPAVAKCN